MSNAGSGQVALSWQPPATFAFGTATEAAQRYRVYLSSDGFAWDEGRDAAGTSLTLGGFATNQVVYARVTAVNQGGESFPTPGLAVRIGNAPRTLVVQGFDSLAGSMLLVQTVRSYTGVTRMLLDRMNRFNYVAQHAGTIPEPFDSAVHQAVNGGNVLVSNYQVIDWFTGGQVSADGVLSVNERQALRNFVSTGNRLLLLSGAHVANYLATSDADFLNNTLHAALVGPATGTAVGASAGGPFAGIPAFTLDDGTGATYDARASEAVAPVSGGSMALRYGDGNAAGVSWASASGSHVVYLSFPFEAINQDSARAALMARTLALVPAHPFTPTHRIFLPTVLRSAVSSCAQIMINGGFEDSTAWQINFTPALAAYTTAQAHAGVRSMQTGVPLGQTGVLTAYSSVSQTTVLPNVAPLTLTLWRYSASQDSDDQFYVSLWGRGDLNRTTAASNGWEKLSFDLSAYAGQPVTLLLGTYNDGDNLKSVAYYDDVAVTCGP
jgi:hypothetical protein